MAYTPARFNRPGWKKFYPKVSVKEWIVQNTTKEQFTLPEAAKKLKLKYSVKGAGQTGSRKWRQMQLPVLQHWNSDLEIDIEVEREEPMDPVLQVGDEVWQLRDLKAEAITAKLLHYKKQ